MVRGSEERWLSHNGVSDRGRGDQSITDRENSARRVSCVTMKENGHLLGRVSQFEQAIWLFRHSSCSSQCVSVALSGIYGYQHIDSYVVALDILQKSNCAVIQFLTELISTYVHTTIFETCVGQACSAVTEAARDASWFQQLPIRSLVCHR
jgi:hypothetical protein